MLPIIYKNINNQEINTVNARELHKFLESKQDFATWIKSRIEHYHFQENQDFVRLHKKMEANNATLIEYHITLDMAKHLCMVDRSEQGREARLYFIECEKKAKQAPVVKELSRMDLIQLAMDAEKENQELRALNTEQVKVITEQKDVIEAQEDFIDSAFKLHDTMSVDYYCKLISNKHNHFGAVKFRSLMKISGRFVMNHDSDSYMPSQEMLNTGQMEYKAKEPYVDCYGVTHEHTQIRITKKGARTLYAVCKKYQSFFKLNDNETKGYHYKPHCERREFLNSLLVECRNG
jgi:phage anti-repressor protein/phage antirepressor YoqD-like protein